MSARRANLVPILTAVPTPCATNALASIAGSVVVRGPGARIWNESRLVLVPHNLGWGWRQELKRGLHVGQFLNEVQIALLLLGTKHAVVFYVATRPLLRERAFSFPLATAQQCRTHKKWSRTTAETS